MHVKSSSRSRVILFTSWSLAACTLAFLLAPATAKAANVECSSELGFCSVSNDGSDFISCTCDGGAGDGGTGANEWAGLSEAELLEICEAELSACEPGPSTTGGNTGDTGGTDSWGTDTGGGSATGTDGGFDTSGDTAGEDGVSGTATGDSGGGTDGGASGEDGPGGTGLGDDGGDAVSAGESDTGGSESNSRGCSVGSRSGFGLLALLCLGVLGLAGRRRDELI